MPNWKIHLEIGNKIGEILEYDNQQMQLFLLGNILPDINNCYIVKNISIQFRHNYTHYYVEGKYETYLDFYHLYKEQIKNPLICGYLVHLYTDYLFNQNFYNRIEQSKLKELEHDELRVLKQDDFQSYNDKYVNNILKIDDIKKAQLETELIEKVQVTSEDIEKVIQFLSKKELSNKKLKFYKVEELDKLMEESVEKIKTFLDEIKCI